MPWQIVHHADLGVLETIYSGQVAPSDLKAAVEANLVVAREQAICLFLADCTTLAGGHSVADLYAVVAMLGSAGITPSVREAVLVPELPGAAREARAYETMCLNRGIEVRLFRDRVAALAWLREM